MTQTFPLPGPVDLDALNDYLMSDRAPPDCMDLSELDGFLAGLIAGPEPILPSEWMPVVWDGEEPVFDSEAEASVVLGSILGRYNDIAEGLNTDPASFAPVFWESDDGTPVVDDWAHGFMHAVSMRTEAWEPVLRNEDSAILLIPIGIIAGRAVPDLDDDMRLSEEAMKELLEDADTMLPACVIGLYAFWRDRGPAPEPQLRH
jgi:uncharacterized protein